MKSIDQVAFIQLEGTPYQQHIVEGGIPEVIDCNTSLNTLAHNAGYAEELPFRIQTATEDLDPLFSGGGYYQLDKKLKHGEDLDFAEAFSLVGFVASSLNRPLSNLMQGRIRNLRDPNSHQLQAVALLAGMSVKEAYAGLTPDELAGMAAATVHLDTVVRTQRADRTLAFGGMGGDKGYPLGTGESKLFSLSTLSAIALAVGGPTHKHHSYPNTSKVAGQSAIEAYGARSDFHTPEAFDEVFKETDLLMSSCHNTRTLHTLSHAIKGETINHVIGPLAFTLSESTPVHGFIGVNEKIHPDTIIRALQVMDHKAYQTYTSSAVYCGTDLPRVPESMLDPRTYQADRNLKNHVRLDEIAPPPYASMVAFSVGNEPAGTYEVTPEDFYTESDLRGCTFDDLIIPNTAEMILRYNTEALSGQDDAKSRYLAMTIGLGIFVRNYLEKTDALDPVRHRVNSRYLRAATEEGLELLKSGQAVTKLGQYVTTTKNYAGNRGMS